MKKVIKIICVVLACIVLIVGGYIGYVFVSFHRLGDGALPVQGQAAPGETADGYTIVSYNIGFGAYEADFGFFMDGGDRAWAWSKERLDTNLTAIGTFLHEQDADFVFVQEVDFDSTRSYHIDERPYLTRALSGRQYTFAQNYDSPFLCYPILQPHGASKSGLMTFSREAMLSASRVELPIETGVTKILDLDRCYAKHLVRTADGKELVLYNFHLSAYTSDGTIATEQLKLLLADMAQEYAQGRYAVAGGDFNKDLLGDSSVYFGKADREYTWAQPIPEGTFDGVPVKPVAPLDEENPVPSCRNADGAYHAGQFVLTVDGFLVTDNVTVISSAVIDTGFAYSDHNPVSMRFVLR
ncbi:MAG: endonuclease/exonuclease/phosphatase family protein [Clostridia bacterium]|nr:endonuclease/exonuclease/phosphatase family protein [Clostridia bacterium]